jgi:hypothetical protein
MTAAQRIAARSRLEDARDMVLDARDGGPDDGGVIIAGSDLYEALSRVERELDGAIAVLRY